MEATSLENTELSSQLATLRAQHSHDENKLLSEIRRLQVRDIGPLTVFENDPSCFSVNCFFDWSGPSVFQMKVIQC